MLVPIYQTTRYYNPEGHSMIFHLRENLNSLISLRNILPKHNLLFRKLVLSFKTLTRKEKRAVLFRMSQIVSIFVRRNWGLLTRIFFSLRLRHWFWWFHTMSLVLMITIRLEGKSCWWCPVDIFLWAPDRLRWMLCGTDVCLCAVWKLFS